MGNKPWSAALPPGYREIHGEQSLYTTCRLICDIHPRWGGGGGTPYNGLYGEVPPERGISFRLAVYKRVGISRVEVYKRVGKTDIFKISRTDAPNCLVMQVFKGLLK